MEVSREIEKGEGKQTSMYVESHEKMGGER